ncbi:hypothetical protein HALO32_02077 [Halomonas lysinitropha]|uniref:Uncharacterized protein n=2 Tax=Halomonas lysinitropha TaxID=2607506 RepID=A0A5K1I2Y4_9GAMM|nr:hypothetical protein HALO32_02077 [Halomonas lysinitropha]
MQVKPWGNSLLWRMTPLTPNRTERDSAIAIGGHSTESDIFRDEGFDRDNPERGGGPPADRGDSHEDGDDHDHEDGEEGGGPPEGRGEHEDGEEHDHEA